MKSLNQSITEKINPNILLNKKKKRNNAGFRDNITFLLMCLPVLLHLLIFSYIPMTGVIIAFKDYNFRDGILGSKFVGFKYFEFFFKSQDAWRITRNTVGLNLIFIFLGVIFAVGLALIMFEINKKLFIKIYQTILILPNFISWVIAGYMVFALLNPKYGLINAILQLFKIHPVSWYSQPFYWPFILAIASVWKSVGVNCIIYYAVLLGIDKEYYEAAALDGANKLQMVRYISIPFLIPVMTILTILAIGNIFRADFGMFYQLTRDSGALYPTTDVIDTYVYRALKSLGEISMSAAVGLFQSIVGFATILVTNFIVRKIDNENALF